MFELHGLKRGEPDILDLSSGDFITEDVLDAIERRTGLNVSRALAMTRLFVTSGLMRKIIDCSNSPVDALMSAFSLGAAVAWAGARGEDEGNDDCDFAWPWLDDGLPPEILKRMRGLGRCGTSTGGSDE